MNRKEQRVLKYIQDLQIWQRSRELVKMIYLVTSDFPSSESFGLTSQMRRASVSIPSNIAEGFGRNSPKDFIRFLKIALGSLYELETQLILSIDLEFINKSNVDDIFSEISQLRRMILSFINHMGI